MTERRNQFHGHLLGGCKKPGRKGMPVETVLEMWKRGMTAPEIQAVVRRDHGQSFLVQTIYALVRRAREEGDPRAGARC